MCCGILISIGIPLGVLLFALVNKREYVKWFLFGVLGFFISQVVIRLPLLNLVQGTLDYTMFLMKWPYVVIILTAFSAAAFEGAGRFLFLLPSRKKDFDILIPLFYGIGHGGFEAFFLLGAPLADMVIFQSTILRFQDPTLIAWGSLERLSAITLHIAVSVFIYLGIKRKKARLILLGILIHTIFDIAAQLAVFISSIAISELMLLALAMLSIGFCFYYYRRTSL